MAPRRRRRDLALLCRARPSSLTLSPNGHDVARAPSRTRSRARASARRSWCRRAGGRRATSLGAWTLVGCTVAPGFQFEGFELAPPGWRPTPRAGRGTSAHERSRASSSASRAGSSTPGRPSTTRPTTAGSCGSPKGYSKRANSASPLVPERRLDDDARRPHGGAVPAPRTCARPSGSPRSRRPGADALLERARLRGRSSRRTCC